MRRLLLTLAVALVSAPAQSPPPTLHLPPQDPGTLTLDAVLPSAATALPTPAQLTLTDAGQPLPILSVTRPANTPILPLLDSINASPADLTLSLSAIRSWLTAQPDPLPHPVAILLISPAPAHTAQSATPTTLETPHLSLRRLGPSTDRSLLLARLQQLLTPADLAAHPGLDPADRVRLSLEALSTVANAEGTLPGPKLLLWISPGWPALRDADAHGSEQAFQTVTYFASLLRSARILLSSISPSGLAPAPQPNEGQLLATRPGLNQNTHSLQPAPPDNPSELFLSYRRLPATARDSSPNDLGLPVLALQSGGLDLRNSNDILALLTRAAADADHLITLSATLPPPASGSQSHLHTLRLTRAGTHDPLRTRTGLYAR